MTDAQYVSHAAQIKGLSLIKPTKASKGILGYNFNQKNDRGVYPCVIDANTWAEARTQINNYYRA